MKYQKVTLYLSDGSVGTFTGPAIAFLHNKQENRIVRAIFTIPTDLPSGYTFETFPCASGVIHINEQKDA